MASANSLRARRLLSAGAAGGHAAALIVVPVLFLVRGGLAGLTALVTALGVLAFMGIGQYVQVRMADANPRNLLLGSMVSYAIRVSVPTVMLIALEANAARFSFDRPSVAITTIAIVLGWLATEILAFSRLRIPVFDEPDEASQHHA